MKKTFFVIASLFLMTTAGFGQSWTWDKAHSQLIFGITHLGIGEIDGVFTTVDAKLTASKDDFSDAVVELTAQTNSINTNNEQRDHHLQSDAFFDAAKYAQITFKSTSFTKIGDKKYRVEGDLTLHGITKHVVLEATYTGTVMHPMFKKPVAGFRVTGIIKRSDFGITPAGITDMLSDDVALRASAEFVKD